MLTLVCFALLCFLLFDDADCNIYTDAVLGKGDVDMIRGVRDIN